MEDTKKDLSEINILKNQIDYGKYIRKIKKGFSDKKQGIPTDDTKYKQFLTFQQPILNELNYVAEKMKTENIKKQKDDFEFNEKLKEEREKKMKELAKKTINNIDLISADLFDKPVKKGMIDITPTINTDLENTIADIDKVLKEEMINNKEEKKKKESSANILQKFARSRIERNKGQKIIDSERQKKQEELDLEEKKRAVSVIQGALRGKLTKKRQEAIKEILTSPISDLAKYTRTVGLGTTAEREFVKSKMERGNLESALESFRIGREKTARDAKEKKEARVAEVSASEKGKEALGVLTEAIKARKARKETQAQAQEIIGRKRVSEEYIEGLKVRTNKDLVKIIQEVTGNPEFKKNNLNKEALLNIIRGRSNLRPAGIKKMKPSEYLELSKKKKSKN